MDETIDYERPGDHESSVTLGTGTDFSSDGPESPRGASGRYTFGSGARPLEGYTIKRAVGRGGFGEVYYAITDAGKEVALKLITRNLDVERRGVNQCMNLKSPHLITIHDMRTTDDGDTFVIMEYVAGPSLASVLEKYPDGMPLDKARRWLRGLVDGVTYLHEHGLVHRDLKPANLFMEEGVVKIGDYGLSKAITHSKEPGHSQSVGTCHYMAPEIGTGKYHKPIDIYAIGVILYEMITGRVPFDGESVHEVLMKHLTSRPDLTPLPEPYKTIVGRALAKDPNHRPARAVDLLPPADAPRAADLRFIPESGQTAAITAGDRGDVLHISDEEPVFYIGPETRPQRRAGVGRGKVLGRFAPKLKAPASPKPAAKPKAAQRQPAMAPLTLAPPQPLPAGRARLAELGTSMILAAAASFVITVLSVVALIGVAHRAPADPTELALIFTMTLLGSWGVMIPSKLMEGTAVSKGTRRLVFLGAGTLVGLASAGIALWGRFYVRDSLVAIPQTPLKLINWTGSSDQVATFVTTTIAAYFAAVFALTGLWELTKRDRKSRFRIAPLFFVGIVAALVGGVIPSPQSVGPLVAVMIASVVQLASPWNREAAAYARFVEAMPARRSA